MGAGGPPPPAIQGPIASAGGGHGRGATPFQVVPQAPPPPANDSGRVTNYTAYVLVVGLMGLISLAVLAALETRCFGAQKAPWTMIQKVPDASDVEAIKDMVRKKMASSSSSDK